MKTTNLPALPLRIAATLLSFAALAVVGCEPPQASRSAPATTPVYFDTNMDGNKLVVVKFGAAWCGPCRSMDKELARISGELPADVEVLSIDVDENPELAERYQISSIPKLMLVRDGKILAEEIGVMSGKQIQNWIAEFRPENFSE